VCNEDFPNTLQRNSFALSDKMGMGLARNVERKGEMVG